MSAITVSTPLGPHDSVVRGLITVDTRQPLETALRVRVATCAADLPYAPWLPAQDVMAIPRAWPGHQQPAYVTVAVEIEHLGGSAVTETAVARLPTRILAEPWPTPTPTPGYLLDGRCAQQDRWYLQQYNDTAPKAGNNFLPLEWHPGYLWSTEHTRAWDVGETPDDLIVAHCYARWVHPEPAWNFAPSSTTYRATLSGMGLDLKGGSACFAVVCVHPDGRRGRYHLVGSPGSPRALAIGTAGSPLTTVRGFPSGSSPDWVCSFAADGVPLASMPSGPSFAIEAVELILRDCASTPTGQLRIHDFSITQ